jgi:hypothetical protein
MVEDVELLDKQFDPTTTLYFQQKVNIFFLVSKLSLYRHCFKNCFCFAVKKLVRLQPFKQFHANLIFGNKAGTLLDLAETLRQDKLLPYWHKNDYDGSIYKSKNWHV